MARVCFRTVTDGVIFVQYPREAVHATFNRINNRMLLRLDHLIRWAQLSFIAEVRFSGWDHHCRRRSGFAAPLAANTKADRLPHNVPSEMDAILALLVSP